MPPGFPLVYADGRVPLRVQVYNDAAVLSTVLRKPKKGVYICAHCRSTFARLPALLDHIDSNNIERPYKCSEAACPWKIVGFLKHQQLRRHIACVHSSQSDYECPVDGCRKMFARVDLYHRHLRTVHENKCSRFNAKLQRQRSSAFMSPQDNAHSPTNSPHRYPKILTVPSASHKLSIGFLTNNSNSP